MRIASLVGAMLATLPLAAHAQTVGINLSAPATMSGGNNSLLVGYPWGGGAQQTLSSTGERQVYQSSGITQNSDGSVTLTAQPNSNTNASWPNNLPYTSGAFSTASINNGMPQPGGFSALYGYFQMTAKLPLGAGLWPAFWLEPVNGKSSCEIDIFEAPFNNPTLIQSSLHDGGTGYTTGQVTTPNYSNNYNTYGVNWSPTTITYYVNGHETGSTPTPASCNTPAYILANLAVGGTSWAWSGTPNGSNEWPAKMSIQSITYNPNGPPGGAGTDGGTFSGGLAGGATSPSPTPVAPATTAPAVGGTGTQPPAQTAQVTPSGGSVTDCQGNTWAVTADNQIEENGALVPNGSNMSMLALDGCTVFALSNGENGSAVGWQSMSTVSQAGNQQWAPATTPPDLAGTPAPPSPGVATPTPTTPAQTAPTTPVSLPPIPVQSCQAGSTVASGGFHVAGGQIIGPDGKAWIARGLDVHDGNLSAAAQQIPTQFPGANLVRVDVDPLGNDPSAYASAVTTLTSRGTVVEFTDYSNSLGTGGGGAQGVVFTGGLLANELAWYQAMASYYKNNPYVWLGTNNEPPGPGGALSTWQRQTYDAIRGTGNNNIIFLEPYGSRPPGYGGTPLMSGMNASVYADMHNVVWDPHIYGYQCGYSTDQATNDALVKAMVAAAQTIQSADGVVPAVVGEYGPGTDPNGVQLVTAVINAGASGTTGSSAWAWDDQGAVDPSSILDGNQITLGSGLTQYGKMVQLFANTSVVPCTQPQITQWAQQATTTIQQATAQDPNTPAVAAPTPANAIQAAQAQSATTPMDPALMQQAEAAARQ